VVGDISRRRVACWHHCDGLLPGVPLGRDPEGRRMGPRPVCLGLRSRCAVGHPAPPGQPTCPTILFFWGYRRSDVFMLIGSFQARSDGSVGHFQSHPAPGPRLATLLLSARAAAGRRPTNPAFRLADPTALPFARGGPSSFMAVVVAAPLGQGVWEPRASCQGIPNSVSSPPPHPSSARRGYVHVTFRL